MKTGSYLVLVALALLLAILQAFDVRTTRIHLGWLGVAFYFLAIALQAGL